ncbi:MAG TPA: DUF5652 family protein [Candidatus Paceibacterota bacterium]|nr:DUF5652 family protein [Candidatus Paceibacterota bacterium]
MHDFSPFFSPFNQGFMGLFFPFFVIAFLWTLVLKGYALWYAARGNQKWWFLALLIINTLGILEIVYLIWFRSKSDGVVPPAPVASSVQG